MSLTSPNKGEVHGRLGEETRSRAEQEHPSIFVDFKTIFWSFLWSLFQYYRGRKSHWSDKTVHFLSYPLVKWENLVTSDRSLCPVNFNYTSESSENIWASSSAALQLNLLSLMLKFSFCCRLTRPLWSFFYQHEEVLVSAFQFGNETGSWLLADFSLLCGYSKTSFFPPIL